MEQPEQVRLGLYYPFIQFRDDSWLKLAALYWDRIGRIVPPGYALQDSDTVMRLQDELGFVTNLAPSYKAMDGVGREFLRLLAERGPELSAVYGVRGRSGTHLRSHDQQWPPPWSNAPPPPTSGPRWQAPVDPSLIDGNDPQLAYVYASGKMTSDLESALVDEGLGVAVRAQALIGMHPQLAFVYMHVLASKMASSVMHPLTEDDFDHAAVGCTAEQIAEALLDLPAGETPQASGTKEPALAFAMLAIQSVIPKDINSLPVQKIIEIRRHHADELAAFQKATQEIVASLPEAVASATPDLAAIYLKSVYEKTLEPELRRLKSGLSRSGIDSVIGSMSVKVAAPELATSGAAMLGIGALHLNPLMMGAGAIILCLMPRIRRQRSEARQLRASSSASYLLRLQENLSPASLVTGVTAKARRLMVA